MYLLITYYKYKHSLCVVHLNRLNKDVLGHFKCI